MPESLTSRSPASFRHPRQSRPWTLSHSLLILAFCCATAACKSDTNKTASGPAITPVEVKTYLTTYWTRDCQSFEECTLTFETPVTINPLQSHTFPNALTVDAYPVTVDFSMFRRNKTINDKGLTTHHRGGVYYFYRNSLNNWEMDSSGVQMIRE